MAELNFMQPQPDMNAFMKMLSGGGNNNTSNGMNMFGGGGNSPFGGQYDNSNMFDFNAANVNGAIPNANMFDAEGLTQGTEGGGLFDFLDSDMMNKIGTGVGAATDIFNLYAGMKGLGIADDRNDLMKTNLSNQAKVTNERLGTRQATRLRSKGITGDENAQAVADFMAKNSVSGG
jgi:hypothetical protein